MKTTRIGIPTLVRIKPGALDRVGLYLGRAGLDRPWVMRSEGLPGPIVTRFDAALESVGPVAVEDVAAASFELAAELLARRPSGANVVVGLGGGRALDTAKYVAHLTGLPYVAVPTSLSNDGFASPMASLTLEGRRRSLPACMPSGVVVDVTVCLAAPMQLWLSGVGDLVAKLTAVEDWKLAFHARGTPVDDFAALLSDATVHQFVARPAHDEEGARLLATALMLNGVAMGVAGSSRPASGSEHLISHALDALGGRERLHGIQVGLATYLCAGLQGQHQTLIARLFDETGFWEALRADPMSAERWLKAIGTAPTIKDDFHTVLSEVDAVTAVRRALDEDPRLLGCFT